MTKVFPVYLVVRVCPDLPVSPNGVRASPESLGTLVSQEPQVSQDLKEKQASMGSLVPLGPGETTVLLVCPVLLESLVDPVLKVFPENRTDTQEVQVPKASPAIQASQVDAETTVHLEITASREVQVSPDQREHSVNRDDRE